MQVGLEEDKLEWLDELASHLATGESGWLVISAIDQVCGAWVTCPADGASWECAGS